MKTFLYTLFMALGMLCMLGACRKDIAWSDSRILPADGWTSSQSIEFNLDPAAYEKPVANRFAEYTARAIGDTTDRIIGDYHATLALRYRQNCNAAQIRIITEKTGLNEPTVTDTLCFDLFDTNGAPIGTGRLGIYEISIPLPGIFHIKEGTILTLQPIEYADTIRGLSDITLYLSSADDKYNQSSVTAGSAQKGLPKRYTIKH